MIGHELGRRYKIVERIGGGGMALVYKAHDKVLNRKVAIKVLRQQFVHDEEFIRRFRREAQAAASLSHPNVVSIYDVGQEGDIHYIVMECIEGYNLNEWIQEKAPLQVDEAVKIAGQICDALDHAHQSQIIHRDIKPHNILIGRNGRVKVTDFGIARAVTSSTITQTGSVVGSVHYFSPEHAKGVTTGEKSDLYSLGIVLYQMLTGRLPFHGESPISVALKHLQEDFEEPRKVNPLIPQSVENIILKAMRKNPSERYQSAREMLHDLETCLLPERLNEPKLTFPPDMDEEPTRVMPAIKPEQHAAVDETSEETEHAETGGPRRRMWVKPLAWALSVIVLLALMWSGVVWIQNKMRVPDVVVPDVVNMPEEDAIKTLQEAGLFVEEPIYEFREDVEAGIVFDQDKKGMTVKEGSYIRIYVSKGIETVGMPRLTGQTLNEALNELLDIGLSETQIESEEMFSEEEPGTVIAQTPEAEEQIDPKTAVVKLTVSKGKETFPMPNLIGLTESEALAKIESHNLKPAKDGVISMPSYAPKGTVFKQFPYEPNDEVSPGAEVSIYVSSGYPSDARTYQYIVRVSPASPGKSSAIRITYTDARGDHEETRKIKDTHDFAISLVLAPNQDAIVRVYRDDQLVGTYPVTYQDAEAGQGSNIPPETPEPDENPAPSEDEPDAGTGASDNGSPEAFNDSDDAEGDPEHD
jgi:serine/threonine-protein kinase